MGKLEQGFNGPFSGKVGNIVGSSWNGINYIKSRPKKRTSPPTEKEQMVQYIFAMTQYWLKPLTAYLRAGFKGYSRTVYGMTAAKSKLYERGLIRDGFNSTVDPAQVLISYGKLPLADGFQMVFDPESFEILIRWSPTVPRREGGQCFASNDDQLMAVAYHVEAAEAYGVLYGELRCTGVYRVALPNDSPAKYHVYVAFINAERTDQSMSKYLGEIRIETP